MAMQKPCNLNSWLWVIPPCCLEERCFVYFLLKRARALNSPRGLAETQSSSGTVHTFRWQSADDYSKDNALHVSNNWQIIYVIFSTVISMEGTNCVANIKPPAEERQKRGVLQKTDGGREEEGARSVDWGRGISARLSFFLTEDAQPSVMRQTHVWPSFVQHLTWCEGFSLAMPTCVADDVCVSSVPWLLAWSCRAMLFTSSVPQAALQGGWGIRCKMASDTQHNQGVPAWILYSAFHHSHPLWTDQSRWMRWIRILIECLGAVIKKNDYIFPKCMKKWMVHWGVASCFCLICSVHLFVSIMFFDGNF